MTDQIGYRQMLHIEGLWSGPTKLNWDIPNSNNIFSNIVASGKD